MLGLCGHYELRLTRGSRSSQPRRNPALSNEPAKLEDERWQSLLACSIESSSLYDRHCVAIKTRHHLDSQRPRQSISMLS